MDVKNVRHFNDIYISLNCVNQDLDHKHFFYRLRSNGKILF